MKEASPRLISLDALRGFTMAAMILVNYPGSEHHIYIPLEHAPWNGLTPTDLIFPFFLFMVGVSIVLSYSKSLEKGVSKKELYRKIVWRSIKIFMVGVTLGLLPFFNFSEVRVAGVLQRIALVFMACSFLYLNTRVKAQVWIGVVLLVGYWLAMTLTPTPGEGMVMLAPGKNLAAWIDTLLLPGSMWQGTWDPEGILSTFPAVVTGMMGMLAGALLRSERTPQEKVNLLMVAGFVAAIVGYVWGLTFPLNKNLWTSSYVLVTGGLASLALGTLYYVVDIRQYTSGTKPGIIFGANAIAIYVLADLVSYLFYLVPVGGLSLNEHFMETFTHTFGNPKLGSMLYALFFVGINFLMAYGLYKKRIFIKL